MKKVVILLTMLLLSAVVQGKSIYLVRHAEKIDDGSKDPKLTAQGVQRAENLAQMLASSGITKVYATAYQRTQLTAKPLAEYLTTEVSTYDPSELSEFARHLKEQADNALVVGHSNTTPQLAHLLSGKPVISLDESDFDNVFQVVIKGDQTTLNVLKSLPSQSTQALNAIKPVSGNYFAGDLVFNMLFKGEVVGQSVHQFNKSHGQYDLTEVTTIEAFGIDATIKVSVDDETMAPINMQMKGSMGQAVDVLLNWQNNHVTGHSEMAREPFKAQGKLAIDTNLREHSLERTSAIMLAHLMPVSDNEPLLINWFNGYEGDSRLINITHEGNEQVTVPAGTFDTYKIKYSGGAPSQYYWIDKQQAKVVKIEVIHMPWSYELVAVK